MRGAWAITPEPERPAGGVLAVSLPGHPGRRVLRVAREHGELLHVGPRGYLEVIPEREVPVEGLHRCRVRLPATAIFELASEPGPLFGRVMSRRSRVDGGRGDQAPTSASYRRPR